MAGQIEEDPFAGSLSDPGIDPFEIPEVPEQPVTAAGQTRASAKPVPGPISPDKKLPPENLYSRMRNATLNALGLNQPALQRTRDSGIFDAPLYTAPGPTEGMTAPGNINLRSLPPVDLGHGQWGTVRSASSEQDGREVLYPTIVNGRPLDEDAARDYAFKTGRNLGAFKDPASADIYAQRLHSDWEKGLIPGAQMSPRPGAGGWRDPALWEPQPNPAYSPRFAAAAQGLGAAIEPSNYGMTGDILGMVGGALPGTMASEVPLKSIPVWGAANMAMRGSAEFEPWKASMMRDFPSKEAQLEDLYQKSKNIYETHISKTPLNELSEHHLPNLQNIVDQYNKGAEGQDWYLHTRPELEAQFGPDSDLFINMLAATSPNATVPANMSLALKAYKAYKNGLTDFSKFSDNPAHPGFMKPVIDNLNHVIRNEPISGQKIINFAKNLRGETEPVTVDRWMMRALGMPKTPLGPNTYKFADYWLSQIAHDQGIEPRQLQAAVWKTAREVGGQSAATGQPFEAMLAKRLAKDPALSDMLSKVRQGAAQAAPAYARGGPVKYQQGGSADPQYRWMKDLTGSWIPPPSQALVGSGVAPSDKPYPGEPTVYQSATRPWSEATGPIGAPGMPPIPPDRSGVYPPDNPNYYQGQLVFPVQQPSNADVKPPLFYKWGWGRGSEPSVEEHAQLQQQNEDWRQWQILQQQQAAGMPTRLQQHAGMRQPPQPPANMMRTDSPFSQAVRADQPVSPDLDLRQQRDPKLKTDLDYWREQKGHAAGGAIRMQAGGWNDPALWQEQPNPAYRGLAGIPSALGQGVVDPVLGTLQLGNALLGGPDAADTDERIRAMRERYVQSLPGGKETWKQWIPRVAASTLALGKVLPPIDIGSGLAGTVGSGALEGGIYGATAPKETAHTLRETGWETALGAGLGVAERFALPPVEREVAKLWPSHAAKVVGAAADVAEEKADYNPPKKIVPSAVEHEAEVAGPELIAQSPLPRAILKQTLHTATDIGESAARSSGPPFQNPLAVTQTQDPSWQDYLNYSGQQNLNPPGMADGGLYGQMRANTLAALRRS